MEMSCTIRRVDKAVLVSSNGLGIAMSWDKARVFATAVKRIGESCKAYAADARLTGNLNQTTHDTEVIGQATIKAAGPALVFELNGRNWFMCNYRQAPAIATGVFQVAATLEEIAKAEQMIADEAFVLRTGLPVGLAYNSKIKKEAWKAAEDVKFDGMVTPTQIFYPPTIILHPPAQ